VADGGARAAAHGRRSGGGDVGEDEEAAENEQAVVEWARKIYDMWTPQIFLSPVDPTLRF
jgi:hypothetical protein